MINLRLGPMRYPEIELICKHEQDTFLIDRQIKEGKLKLGFTCQ